MEKKLENLSPTETDALAFFKKSLVEIPVSGFLKMILFGSRARGEGDIGSDIDVLVLVEKETHSCRKRIFDLAAEIFLQHEINISPFVISKDRFDGLKEIERGIALEIEKEGIEI